MSALFLFCFSYLVKSRHRRSPGSVVPAGAPGLPVVGNLLDIPLYHSWSKFDEWSKWYGPLSRLNIAGRDHVTVSTEDIADGLLHERGNIYRPREQLFMAAKLLSANLQPLLYPHREIWRKGRKQMHNLTNVLVATSHRSL